MSLRKIISVERISLLQNLAEIRMNEWLSVYDVFSVISAFVVNNAHQHEGCSRVIPHLSSLLVYFSFFIILFYKLRLFFETCDCYHSRKLFMSGFNSFIFESSYL